MNDMAAEALPRPLLLLPLPQPVSRLASESRSVYSRANVQNAARRHRGTHTQTGNGAGVALAESMLLPFSSYCLLYTSPSPRDS